MDNFYYIGVLTFCVFVVFVQLKRQFGVDYTLFGGAVGFNKWMDTFTDPVCSNDVWHCIF